MSKENNKRDVVISHVFHAKPELVFKAWTKAEYLEQWYAPDGCTVVIKNMNARLGGTFQFSIRNPKNYGCWCIGEYLEFNKPGKLVFSLTLSDENGNPVEAKDIGMDPEMPQTTIVSITFEKHPDGTMMTLHQTVDESLAKRTGAYPSWIQMFNRLNTILLKEKSIHVEG